MPRLTPSFPTPGALPEFASGANRVAVMTVNLADARQLAELHIGGTALWVVDASSANASATFFLRDQQTAGIPLSRGFFMSGVPFDKPLITNAAQPGETLTIVYVTEQLIDHFEVVNPNVQNAVEIAGGSPSNGDTIADVTLNNGSITTILAANADTYDVTVQSDISNTVAIRVGPGENVAATRGAELQPGQSVTILGSAIVSGFSGAAGQVVNGFYSRW